MAAAAALPDPPALRLRSLSKRYGDRYAVRDLDLELRTGEVFALLGPNGSGKSTTLNMVLGLIRPTSGSIEIRGQALTERPAAALREVGGLVEGPSFYPYLSGRQNLRLLAELRGIDGVAVERALDTVGLAHRGDDKFDAYSLGMRQRLGIASTLMHQPQLIILDEPTNGLDPEGTREIRELIPQLAAAGQTVLLASHLLHEVEQVSDRVAIMRQGLKISEGSVAELLSAGDQIRIVVDAASVERAVAVLRREQSVTGIEQGRDGVLLVSGATDSAALNRALVAEGVFASELAHVSQTLESLFLAVTSQEATA